MRKFNDVSWDDSEESGAEKTKGLMGALKSVRPFLNTNVWP